MSESPVGRGRLESLAEALARAPGIADQGSRDALVVEVRTALRRPFDPARSPDVRIDLVNIVDASARASGGLRTLARILRQRHPGSASARFSEYAVDVVGPAHLSPPDREALRAAIATLPIELLFEAATGLPGARELDSVSVWLDRAAAIRQMERLALPEDGVPQVVSFANRLAARVDDDTAERLRGWISTVAGGLGVDPATLATVRTAAAPAEPPPGAAPAVEAPDLIWSGVPIRNRNFTGREELLDRLAVALRSDEPAAVLPQALHGLGGVGKTQLVTEYVYQNVDKYDVVWWIAAEETSAVLTSLNELAGRLHLPVSDNRQKTAGLVFAELARTDLAWLLVYDNAVAPEELRGLLPPQRGHVVITTRDRRWETVGKPIEVDVFKRDESVRLLRNRARDGNLRIEPGEAEELAEKLGDLPLALEQAAAWCLATAMPIREYIDLLDEHVEDLMNEGKPSEYPRTVVAFVSFALERLRTSPDDNDKAAAQLLGLFAFLGGEPVQQSLLRKGRNADLPDPLRRKLGQSIAIDQIVGKLSDLGLAKVDPSRRVQVHRLVQLVIRDAYPEAERAEIQRQVQDLLATANPGDPDEVSEHDLQRELGAHLKPADMINAGDVDARGVVLDHARYLWIAGDYEGSRKLAVRAASAWTGDTSDPRFGPDGEMTLLARAQVANALRTLGRSREASAETRDIYDRFQNSPLLGPRNPLTLVTGNQIGADLRIAGRYRDAYDFDLRSVDLHRSIFRPGNTYTLRAEANLAVDHRMLGQFASALELDESIAHTWEDAGGGDDERKLSAYMNMARDYYGMGSYQAGLGLITRWRTRLQQLVGPDHPRVLLAGRTYAITLRKAGHLVEAADVMRENHQRVHLKFGPVHEFSVAATMSYANVLREAGELDEALARIEDAVRIYREYFDADGPHPLTLVAQVNEAIIRRARGEFEVAHDLGRRNHRGLVDVLGENHPYTICAGTSLASDLALAGDPAAALDLSRQMYELSQDAYGSGDHPYVLMRAANLSYDLAAMGFDEEATPYYERSVEGLRRALGVDHPEFEAVLAKRRMEGDIEPPPT
ncbi:FxSxx-COOH system tetratricopeptide repeat protein [Virgisporangium aurantiacum]|uniref:Cytochrome c n=1 Tax=Virgisporangium aurantiacum TaxID=175570 RepID=A0A8J3YX95_9ACTN|nr:FxSxx-COOH system tetratricopeptide repeat protein [Virgisporangium aurantiacum]GIJ53311.1 cytochrome c [Virgisporangium aurantiacum]